MKLSPSILSAAVTLSCLVLTPSLSAQPGGRGMPVEARQQIHTLLNQHAAITRELQITTNGYIAVTESDQPEIAATLRAHVQAMKQRLDSGMPVRRWDPAFEEYFRYYQEMDHQFTTTEKGIRVVVTGKSPEAIAAAQNHARVIVDFVQDGWQAHDRSHPASTADSQESGTPSPAAPQCCRMDKQQKNSSNTSRQCRCNADRRNRGDESSLSPDVRNP